MRLDERSWEKVKGHPPHFYKSDLITYSRGLLAIYLGIELDSYFVLKELKALNSCKLIG